MDSIRRQWAKAAFGEAPLETSYPAWLKQQPAWFRDDVLGPSPAAAFRRGELNLTRFVDATGRRYTLEELARRDGVEIPLRRRTPEELSKDLVVRGDPRRKDLEVAGPRQRG
ncbi:MAG: hypothetical protein JXQ29_11035 [Planctomycetes bacterium]|nr:hypothetical protein [Planctomycetota bacterium]